MVRAPLGTSSDLHVIKHTFIASTYPLSIINMLVSGGLLLLHTSRTRLATLYNWDPPFRAYYPVILCFFLSNVFLVFAPLIPPAPGFRPYKDLPYWVRVSLLTISLFVLTRIL